MGPYQRTPRWGARAIRYSGFFGVRSLGPVGDFLEIVGVYIPIIRIPTKGGMSDESVFESFRAPTLCKTNVSFGPEKQHTNINTFSQAFSRGTLCNFTFCKFRDTTANIDQSDSKKENTPGKKHEFWR